MSLADRNLALRRLRAEHQGLLQIGSGGAGQGRGGGGGDRLDPVCFVFDPATGNPVTPVHPDALAADSVTLHAPDDGSDSVQVLAAATPIDPTLHEAADRYLAYFARAPFPRWAMLEIESLRLGSIVLDASEVRLPNPLRRAEPGLCKLLNADPARLARLCELETGTAPAAPLCVGVDFYGIDIRARFGIVRLDFPAMVTTPDAARALIDDLLRKAGEP